MTIPGQVVSLETIAEAVRVLLEPLAVPTSPKYGGFKIVSRRFKTPDQVSVNQTPSLYILQGPISNIRRGGVPNMQTISLWLFIYTNPEPTDVLPSTTLNNAVTAVNAILVNPLFPLQEQTLNGLVSNCWVDGEIIYDSGEVQPPGLAVMPLKVLVPAMAI